MDEKKIEFIIPAYNEEENIQETLELVGQGFPLADILVVDDGSKDRTNEICHEKKARCIRIEHNGYGTAVRKGFENARGAYLVLTDADLPYEPAKIKKVLDEIKDEDMIILEREQPKNPVLRRILSELYKQACAIILSDAIKKEPPLSDVNGIKIIKRSALSDVKLCGKEWIIGTEIVYKFKKKNKKIRIIRNFECVKRRKGRSKVTVSSAMKMLYHLIKLRFGQ